MARNDPDVRRVISTPDAEKAVRAAGYTKGIDGWRAGRAVLDAQERIRKAEQRPEALRPDDPGAMRTVRRRQEHARLQGELMRAQRVIESLRHDRAILKNSAETAQKRLAALRNSWIRPPACSWTARQKKSAWRWPGNWMRPESEPAPREPSWTRHGTEHDRSGSRTPAWGCEAGRAMDSDAHQVYRHQKGDAHRYIQPSSD